MSFAVKRIDTGEYLDEEGYWTAYTPYLCSTREEAEVDLTAYRDKTLGLEIVELVEKPAPVVVSEEEAEMLKNATCDDDPAELIVGFVNSHDKYDDERKAEDRLMRAYVVGWTVEKPKRFVLPMEGTVDEDSEYQMYAIVDSGIWGTVSLSDSVAAPTVTQANIDAAPDWVKAIKAVEVTDDEND